MTEHRVCVLDVDGEPMTEWQTVDFEVVDGVATNVTPIELPENGTVWGVKIEGVGVVGVPNPVTINPAADNTLRVYMTPDDQVPVRR